MKEAETLLNYFMSKQWEILHVNTENDNSIFSRSVKDSSISHGNEGYFLVILHPAGCGASQHRNNSIFKFICILYKNDLSSQMVPKQAKQKS